MGLLDDASPWLASMMQSATANAQRTTTYIRGAERIDLTGKAWFTNSTFRRDPTDGGGANVIHGDRDYMIPAVDLVIDDGTAWEPEKGDRVEETTAGVTLVFDVLPILGEPESRWSDHERTIYRVHTKEHK